MKIRSLFQRFPNISRTIGTLLLMASSALYITAVALPRVYVKEPTEFGLFRTCIAGQCGNIERDCSFIVFGFQTIAEDCGRFNAARAFAVLSIVFTLLATISSFWNVCKKDYFLGAAVGVIGSVASGVFGLLALGLIVHYKSINIAPEDLDFGLSFYLIAGAAAAGLLGSLSHGLSAVKPEQGSYQGCSSDDTLGKGHIASLPALDLTISSPESDVALLPL